MRHHKKRSSRVECAWFALCKNQAVTTRDHPILGKVPICERCHEKMESFNE